MLLYIFRVIYGKTGKLLCLRQFLSMGQKNSPVPDDASEKLNPSTANLFVWDEKLDIIIK